jgi:predicted TPR repeat methyltransferase
MTRIAKGSTPALLSSGDLVADRRFAYAQAMADQGDFDAAADLLVQVLERVPDWPAAWFKLGEIHTLRRCKPASIDAFTRALALDPADELGAALHLARFGATAPPRTAPQAYVRSLFDQYAGRFERHLLDGLDYRAPALLRDAVANLGARTFAHAIDLGCGTGLAGVAFGPLARHMTGVDLSPGMVRAARAKGIYDRLEIAEVEAFLAGEPAASADLLIAADVLCYIGDLMPVMRSAHEVLALRGLFAATLQKGVSGFAIGADLRFAHAPPYVQETAAAQGFATLYMQEAALRRDAGNDVAGLVVVLRRESGGKDSRNFRIAR